MPKSRDLSTQRRFSILERDNFTCLFCGARPGNERLHVDHFIPRSAGGSDHDNNLGASCDRCNNGKSDRVFVPRSICAGGTDAQGWLIWRRWGDWLLTWDTLAGRGDAAAAIVFGPENYAIDLDRVHEPDWHEHLAWKSWMKDDDEQRIIEAHHAAYDARHFDDVPLLTATQVLEREHPLERRRAHGQRWLDFCDAMTFGRSLMRPPRRAPR